MFPMRDIYSFFLLVVTFIYTLTDSSGNPYGQYGSDWMYFPDGDGIPRFINLQPKAIPSVALRMKPDVEFRLHTKKNLGKYIILDNLNEQIDARTKRMLPRIPLKVITHGWMSAANKSSVMDLVDAYLKAYPEITIIAVDWSGYANNYMYMSVVNETREVGRIIAEFLNQLHDHFNVSGDQIHLIGHSLGAHIMGIAGYTTKLKIGRITGLDPALPMFTKMGKVKTRLDYNDAVFVDVIHTCGGVLGFWDAIGTADYYPNNGMAPQPGCSSQNIFQFEACSHGRAIIYFSESILNPTAFPAYECNGWNHSMEKNCPLAGFMGENANWNMSGIFYLQTNSKEPYGRGLLRPN